MSYARLAKVGNLYTQFMSDDERRRRARDPDDEFDRVTTEVSPPGRAGSSEARPPQRVARAEVDRPIWRPPQDFALDSMENVLFSIARFKE